MRETPPTAAVERPAQQVEAGPGIDGKSLALQGLHEVAVQQGASQPDGGSTVESDLPVEPGTPFKWPLNNDQPPSGYPLGERGEGEREIIGRANFYDYYLYRQGDDDRENAVHGIEYAAEAALGKHVGSSVITIIGEFRSNYKTWCFKDIQNYYADTALHGTGQGDTGHRDIIVSRDTATGAVCIDYYDPCPVKARTYNIYAKAFEQRPEELLPEELEEERIAEAAVVDKAAAEETAWLRELALQNAQQDLPEEERESVTLDDVLDGVDPALFSGSPDTEGQSGRGIGIFMSATNHQLIERFGPHSLGAHIQLTISPEGIESILAEAAAEAKAKAEAALKAATES